MARFGFDKHVSAFGTISLGIAHYILASEMDISFGHGVARLRRDNMT
jgi:hypothetical protein